MKDIDEIDIEQSEEVPLPDMDPVCYYYYYLNGKGDAGAFPKLVGAFKPLAVFLELDTTSILLEPNKSAGFDLSRTHFCRSTD